MAITGKDIAAMRQEYAAGQLDESSVLKDPFLQFGQWFEQAVETGVNEPNAMSLATVSADGRPTIRVVLLKGFDTNGFVFFTNYHSRKGYEMLANDNICLNFFWPELERQVRIEGKVAKVSEAESDEYFSSRPRESRIGAWSSPQSQVIPSREVIEANVRENDTKYPGENVPRPPHWGGYRLTPAVIEFWQGRPSRLHDRILFERHGNEWKVKRLAP